MEKDINHAQVGPPEGMGTRGVGVSTIEGGLQSSAPAHDPGVD